MDKPQAMTARGDGLYGADKSCTQHQARFADAWSYAPTGLLS